MGKLAAIKTQETNASIDDFVKKIPDESKRDDTRELIKMMQAATGEQPRVWGSSMIGFGNKRYKSPNSQREVDWFKIGFSPRKSKFSLHLVLDIKAHTHTLKKLGKHKTGVGCLYIIKLADVDIKVLEKLINTAAKSK